MTEPQPPPFDLRAAFDALADLPTTARAAALANGPYTESQRAELTELLAHLNELDPIPGRILAELEIETAPLPERIGPYRILSLLGSGGMGQVYRAERADGLLQQQLAIKLIRARHDAGLLQHFQRERQVLASLQHPNIARFLDAGLHEGQPWLAMELIEGVPMLDWLRQEQPPLTTRIQVFLDLADAVAHAHQRLIVHRDLKPANILVRADHRPVLLDFGIAKMLDQESDRTIARFYTPGFAAPEQLAGEPITTAADIYALGVLLHVLLCAEMPDADLRASTQAARGAAWLSLDARAIRGDLDYISRMARARDPAERYGTVSALIDDLQRWQDGLPVRAAPGRLWYRARKWVWRNRLALSGAAVLFAVALGFVWRLDQERQRALEAERTAAQEAQTANAVTQYLVGLFAQVDPRSTKGRNLSARELLQQASSNLNHQTLPAGDTESRLRLAIGSIWSNLGMFELADQELKTAYEKLPPAVADSRLAAEILREHARALQSRGFLDPALAKATQALTLSERWMSADDPGLGHSLHTAGVALMYRGRTTEATQMFRRAETIFSGKPELAADLASSHHNLGFIATELGQHAEAERWFRLALAEKIAAIGPDDPRTLNTQQALAVSLDMQGRRKEALPMLQEVVARRRRVLGEDSQELATTLNEMGSVAQDDGNFELAEASYREGLAIVRRNDADAALHSLLMNNLASLLEDRGDLPAARALIEQSLALRVRLYGLESAQAARAQHNLARVLNKLGAKDEAQREIEQALATRVKLLGETHADTVMSRDLRARILDPTAAPANKS